MTVNPGAAHPLVRLRFTRLISDGEYSLFENHFTPDGVRFTPLDGVGTRNNFRANAAGAPTPFTHADAILLTYHSDGRNHGAKRGALGVVAHHQLIMRFP